ncbi:MAG TPA: hypothetical protein VMT58_07420 [Candidatus Binataceae bacterium]|nr:hypothetical protein [Candidatus Binataceae bacterium]
MDTIGGWELIEPPVGSGGQGTVYKARSPERKAAIDLNRDRIRGELSRMAATVRPSAPDIETDLSNFISSMTLLTRPDDPATELGALKKFNIPSDNSAEAKAAIGRFEREIEALQTVKHPGILKLIYRNPREHCFVTEYHAKGTLAANQSRYKGDVRSALKAFRTIVDAVAELHKRGSSTATSNHKISLLLQTTV